MGSSDITRTTFGGTGREVTVVGLGGEGVLRTHGREEEARAVIRAALDRGLTYFDCARAYAGSEGYYGLIWGDEPELRAGVFQAGKSAQRSKEGALKDLETTFSNMKTDRLDLWQIHDVRDERDLRAVEARGGALEAFSEARERGAVRHIGVTGHHDPRVLTHAVSNWPVDSVMMPVNPVESALGGFLTETLPAAKERGIAVVGMKILGAGHYIFDHAGATAERLISFALAQGITVAIAGCSTPGHVAALAAAGEDPSIMPEDEQQMLIELFRPHAKRLAFYRGVV